MTRGSSPTAEQVQRVGLTLASPRLSAEKGKKFVIMKEEVKLCVVLVDSPL